MKYYSLYSYLLQNHMPERLIHRGQDYGDKFSLPNSFESWREKHENQGDRAMVEFDVLLLQDGTLGILHPADFEKEPGVKMTDADIESMNQAELENLKILHPETARREGQVPLFSELVSGCYDRGIPIIVEVKASSPDKAEEVFAKVIEEIERLEQQGIFEQGQHPNPEYLQTKFALGSFSIEGLQAARKMLDAKGRTDIALQLFWSSAPQWAAKSAISATSVDRLKPGENWERTGVDTAAELGCKSITFQPLDTITPELSQYVHEKGMTIQVGKVGKTELIEKFMEREDIDKVIF